ncbi:MAG: hypothetical protein RLZ22_318, partial [Verrucomicrobiota bacterium]
LYRMLIQRGAPNLFCLHPPFQIDGNFGGTAAVAEMLLQCHCTDAKGQRIIHLLPALPPAWNEGRVNGLRTRGGHQFNLAWKQNQAPQVEIIGGRDETITLRYGATTRELQLKEGETMRVD